MASETIRPDADVAIGAWTDDGGGTTNIHDAIDETTASDTDYIKSDNNPTTASPCEIGFGAVTDETPHHGRLSYRYRQSGGRNIDLNVQLKQGSQIVQEWTHTTIGTSWATADQFIGAQITDWSDIRVVFNAQNTTGGGAATRVDVSWSEITTAVVKTIGSGKDYSTFGNWNSNLDNTTYPTAGTVAEGQAYNEAFDETFTINTSASNLIGVALTAAEGERHDGTAGSGARIVRTGDCPVITIARIETVVDWLEIDMNGNGGSAGVLRTATFNNVNPEKVFIRNNIVHSLDTGTTTNFPWLYAVQLSDNGGVVFCNNAGWYVRGNNTSRDIQLLYISTSRALVVVNNTMHDSYHEHATDGECYGFDNLDVAAHTYKNNVATECTTASSATAKCWAVSTSSNADCATNGSDDSTAPSAMTGEPVDASVEFVSDTDPYDLHLTSSAECDGAGTDLVCLPPGAHIAMPVGTYTDGYDRDTDPESVAANWAVGAFEYLSTGSQTVSPTGVTSGEAIGSLTLKIYVEPTGIATAEAIGSHQVDLTIFMTGVATTEAVGSHQIDLTIFMTGVATTEAVGSHTVVGAQSVTLTSGIASEEAIGSHTIVAGQEVLPSGIASAEAIGSPTLTIYVLPSGITSEEAIGSHDLDWPQTVSPTGVATEEAIGSPQIDLIVFMTGVASAEAIGSHTIKPEQFVTLAAGIASAEAIGSHDLDWPQTVSPAGIATAEAIGSPLVSSLIVSPNGIASAEVIGSHDLDWPQTVSPTGIATAEALGSPTLTIYVLPSGIATAEAIGSHLVYPEQFVTLAAGIASAEAIGSLTLTIYVEPSGVASAEAIGSHDLDWPQTISPTGIATAEVVGSHVVSAIIVQPTGITSAEAIGTHTITPGTVTVSPSGVVSAEAVGSPTLTIYVLPSGIASAEGVGPAWVQQELVVTPEGIPSEEAIGLDQTVSSVAYVAPSGVASAEALGALTIATGAVTVLPAGIASAEAVGSHTVNAGTQVSPSGVATGEAIGSHNVAWGQTVTPTGVATAEAIGTHAITAGVTILPTGVTSAEAVGSPTLLIYVSPTGIGTVEAVGTPALTLYVLPGGITTAEAVGSHTVIREQFVLPAGVAAAEAIGTPRLGLYVLPVGVTSEEAIGTLLLTLGAATVAPVGIASAEVIGNHQVIGDFGGLFIPTDGIFVSVF